jgi:hypothetical protein
MEVSKGLGRVLWAGMVSLFSIAPKMFESYFMLSGMLLLMSSCGAPQQLSDRNYAHILKTESLLTQKDGSSCGCLSVKPAKTVLVHDLRKVKSRLLHFSTVLNLKGGGNSDSRRKPKTNHKPKRSDRTSDYKSAGDKGSRKHPGSSTLRDAMISEPDASEREWTDMCEEGESDDGTIDLAGESISDVDMGSESDSSSSQPLATSRPRRRASDTHRCALLLLSSRERTGDCDSHWTQARKFRPRGISRLYYV